MTLRVRLTARAQRDIDEIQSWWATNRSADQASRWYDAIIEAVGALGTFPRSSPLADENDEYEAELRCLLIGLGRHPTHRVLYTIRDDTIVVLTVRHVARDRVDAEDLGDVS